MRILSIETSADDTGVSIMEVQESPKGAVFTVLANGLASQIKVHAEFGGIYPALAKREHIKNLPILFKKVMTKAFPKFAQQDASKSAIAENDAKSPVDLIIVTSGPGLEPALWTGIVFAKELGEKWNVPLMPANHMQGHILSVFGKSKGTFSIPKINFPALSLLVSGGHTELVLSKDWNKYEVIGETVDDAAGEAFDKVARMLDLPYPGGPEISRLAEQERKLSKELRKSFPKVLESPRPLSETRPDHSQNLFRNSFTLPRPMMYTKNFDFSFSGLKTAVLYLVRDLNKINGKLNDKTKAEIAHEFENAVVETLVHKTKKALEKYKIQTFIVGGGVSANKHLKMEMNRMTKVSFPKLTTFFPDKKLTGDNSIMIGIAGYLQYIKNKRKVPRLQSIKAEGNMRL